jgi:hypothetical protein
MKTDKKNQYTHAWSLGEALGRVFTAMSSAPPLEQKWLDELNQARPGVHTLTVKN